MRNVNTLHQTAAAPVAVPRSWLRFALVIGGGLVALLAVSALNVSLGRLDFTWADIWGAIFNSDGSLEDQVIRFVRLPRLAAGILAGVALAIAGVLMQSVTRNPLASASTIGVNAGATLAVVFVAIYVPSLSGVSPALVPFIGGAIAAGIVFLLSGGAKATPDRMALAGMAVTLALAAGAGALQLLHEQAVGGLFFWGAGSLMQSDWSNVQYGLPRLLVAVLAAFALGRSLDVLGLGDDVAKGLGMRTHLIRPGAFIIAIFLAATAVAITGPIGFIGIVAPHLVRLLGVTRHHLLIPAAGIWGAVVVVASDAVAQLVGQGIEIPAGIVTALVGAPWFVWLARRVGSTSGGRSGSGMALGQTRMPFPLLLALSVVIVIVSLAAGMKFGEQPVALLDIFRSNVDAERAQNVMLTYRLPRLVVAGVAGACLAASGSLVQGVARNPLASPELVGVTSGAGLAALVTLLVIPGFPVALIPVAAFVGGLVAFGIVYALAWKGGLAPARLALVGIAISAACSAGINLLVVQAGVRVSSALVWISGSTYGRTWDDLWRMAPWAIIFIPVALMTARWVDLLALGDDLPRGLGLPIERVRALLLLTGVALASAAVATVGTVSFVGLMAPHSAGMLAGGRTVRRLPIAMLLGATLLILADTLGRSLIAPREIPSGLVTALIGAPYFLFLLRRVNRTG